MFLLPGLVITCHVTGTMDRVLPREHRTELVRYLTNHQNEDGGRAAPPACAARLRRPPPPPACAACLRRRP